MIVCKLYSRRHGLKKKKQNKLCKPVIVCLASQKLENSLSALFLPPADIWLASSPLCSCLSYVLAAAVLGLLPLSPPVSVNLSVIVQCPAELTECLVSLTPVLPFSNPHPPAPDDRVQSAGHLTLRQNERLCCCCTVILLTICVELLVSQALLN